MVYVPKLTTKCYTHSTRKKCIKDENRKQEKFTVQDVPRERRKRQQSIKGEKKENIFLEQKFSLRNY